MREQVAEGETPDGTPFTVSNDLTNCGLIVLFRDSEIFDEQSCFLLNLDDVVEEADRLRKEVSS